jgi:alanine racemase
VARWAVAEVSLRAITHNLETVRRIARNRPVLAVVKADAYGHGAIEVSKHLLKEGVSCLAVAYTGEARELRDAGINAPLIVLFDRGDIKDYFDLDLIPVVYTKDAASAFSQEAVKRGTVKKVHVKIDTGMGRLGLNGKCAFEDLAEMLDLPGVEITGLLSHFSEADLLDRSYARLQLERFNAIREAVSEKLKRKIMAHIANSAAVLSFEDAYLDAVRPGIMLYGYSPVIRGPENPPVPDMDLIPAMTVKARLLCIRNVPSGTPVSYGRTFVTARQSRIGVIAIGYADGYPRSLSNKAEVLVRGRRAPVAGRVCMDLTMADLTDVAEAEENDEVVILGRQGNELITADELASKADTISYEILTSLGSRSKKIYVEAG